MTRVHDHTQCQARTFKEDLLHEVIVEAINSLIDDEDYLEKLEASIREVMNEKYDETVEQVDEKLHQLQKELYQTANNKDDYENIAEEIYVFREKKQELLIANATNEEKGKRLSDIKAFLKAQHIELKKYDESLVNRLVEEVRVKEEILDIKLKTGQIITIEK